MSERLARLKDRHRGGRCVIVANGPSLNGMDLSFLRREITIGLNKIHLGLERFRFYPRYYVAVNSKVVQQSLAPIRALNCVKLISAHAAQASGLQEDALTYLVRTDQPPQRFCTDLTQGLHEGWTVTHAALQFAYHLGFDDVVLIGLDHRYAYEGQPNETRVMDGDDPNHFSGAYFGHGQNWDNPDLAESEQSYRAALEAYRQSGRSLRDATVQGACTVFPKADYRRVFSIA